MELLSNIEKWANKGYFITYIIIDQIENGYGEDVEDGRMPRYTYTLSICKGFENEIWYYSFDTLEEGFNDAFAWLKKNAK